MRKIVYIHLPKTGGTSFRNALCSAFGADNVSPPFVETFINEHEADYLDKYRVISGHISFSDVEKYFDDRDIITILREPVDRSVSWYFYAHSLMIKDVNIDVQSAQLFSVDKFFNLNKFVTYRNIYNRQVRQLAGHALDYYIDMKDASTRARAVIDRCAWVGLQETLGEDLKQLAEIYPELAGIELPVANVTPSRKHLDELDDKVIAAVRRLNNYDLSLYRGVVRTKARPKRRRVLPHQTADVPPVTA